MSQRVLVTGYGGFLGKAVSLWLLRNGFQVRGLARQPYPDCIAAGVEGIQGDLRDPDCLLKACHQVDAVVHTAAIAGVWGDRRTFESINVTGTTNLLEAAKQSGVQAFVYSSSPSVTFDGQPQSGIDESTPYPTQWLCDYPRTKAIAEGLVQAANQPGRLLTCSLRPHLIWGHGDPHLIPRVIQRCQQGRLRRVGSGRNLIDTIHVENAALAHGLAVQKLLAGDTQVAGQNFFVTDGEPIACWDWITCLLDGAQLAPPNRSISLTAAYRLGWAMEVLFKAMRIQSEPPMTRFVALQLGVDHFFSIDKARRLLGYHPSIDRAAQMEKMSHWLRTLVT